MTISDMIASVVEGIYGETINKEKLFHLLEKRFLEITQRQWGSVLPPDHCYNRINKGARKRKFFEYLGTNSFKVWGEYADFNGPVFWHPIGLDEIKVGKCIKGEQIIEEKYLNLLKIK